MFGWLARFSIPVYRNRLLQVAMSSVQTMEVGHNEENYEHCFWPLVVWERDGFWLGMGAWAGGLVICGLLLLVLGC